MTLNPAIDEALAIGELVLGATNRCELESLDPGGKGLNASRVIHRLGRATLALGFVGGVTGAMIRERLDVEGVPHTFDDVDGFTRFNVMVYERSTGRRTRLYGPGARVEARQLDRLRARLADLPAHSMVVLAGSVPPGLPAEVYRELTAWLKRRGFRVVVDAQGAALAAVLAAGPTLIKPNVEEAAELLGRPLNDDRDVLAAAMELRERGVEHVVVSQAERGAIGVGPDGCWKAVPPAVVSRSTVGSGDSMVAGMAIGLAEGEGLDGALRLGTAAGAATAITPGTQLCSVDDVRRFVPLVTITRMARVRAEAAGSMASRASRA